MELAVSAYTVAELMVGRRGLEPRPDRLRVCYASITPATQMSRHLRSNGLTVVGVRNYDIPTYRLKGDCSSTELHTHMEGYMGIEPTSSDWKSEIIAIIRIPQMEARANVEIATSPIPKECSSL